MWSCRKIFIFSFWHVTDPPKSSAFSPWPVKRDDSASHQPDSQTNDVTDDIAERSDDEEEEEDEDLDEDDDEVHSIWRLF